MNRVLGMLTESLLRGAQELHEFATLVNSSSEAVLHNAIKQLQVRFFPIRATGSGTTVGGFGFGFRGLKLGHVVGNECRSTQPSLRAAHSGGLIQICT